MVVHLRSSKFQLRLLCTVALLGLSSTQLQAATTPSTVPVLLESSDFDLEFIPETDANATASQASETNSFPPQPFLIASPNNINPGLRVATPPPLVTPPETAPSPPPVAPPPEVSPPAAASPAVRAFSLENLQVDFRRDRDNFGQINQFVEPTFKFNVGDNNRIRVRTGFNTFEQSDIDFVSNIPLQIGYETRINQYTIQAAAGIDLFNRLPTAINFNARVDAPIAPNVTLSGIVEQGPYKFNARTLENQITSFRLGPNLFWQIDPNTSLFSLLRLGSYNDGNFEQQSFTRLERRFGQFFLAANLFNWIYSKDVQETSGYFSPPDFLVYNGEVGWEGEVFEFLRCRVAANLGQQRLNGEISGAGSYQGRCTTRISPNIDADLGYTFSNVRQLNTGESAYNNQSFTGILRVNF